MADTRDAYALGEPVTILSNPYGTFVTVETATGHTTGSWDARLLTLADPPSGPKVIWDMDLQHVSIDVVDGLGFEEKLANEEYQAMRDEDDRLSSEL